MIKLNTTRLLADRVISGEHTTYYGAKKVFHSPSLNYGSPYTFLWIDLGSNLHNYLVAMILESIDYKIDWEIL